MHLTQALHQHLRQSPQTCAACDDNRTLTWAELVDQVARFAGALLRDGLQPGDRVAMLARNDVDYLIYIFGTFWAGGVINPVNWRWTIDEIAFSLNDSGAKFLFLGREFLSDAGAILSRSACIDQVIALGGPPPQGALAYDEWLYAATPVEDVMRQGDDLAAILYTGGTTGRAKGVMLSHANMASSNVGILIAMDAPATPTHLHCAPLFHIGSLSNVLLAVTVGSTSVFLPAFDPSAVPAAIERWRVTELFLVPTMIRMVLDHPDFSQHDVSSLQRLRYGAASIDEALLERAMAAFPSAGFVQAYGMTELGPVATVLPMSDHLPDLRTPARLRSAGRATATCEVRIFDPDDRELPAGEVGEVVARGPNVMLGYWGLGEASAQALRHGWMHTGDLGFLDADGYLTIIDRLKDMIVTGGENVFSAEVENIVATCPGVDQVAVIAVPDQIWGERVHAVIVPRDGMRPSPQAIARHCRLHIAGYKVPRSFTFVDRLPLSPAGKVQKNVLRAMAVDGK